MRNGWTGGQYSVFRIIFGVYLFIHFAMLLPWGAELFSNQGVLPDASASPLTRLFPNLLAIADSPSVVTALLIAAVVSAGCFVLGIFDRAAAILMWYVLACTFGRNPLIANPSLPYAGWLLIAHALIPPAPYGSLAARGRIDPRGGWKMPDGIFAAAWIAMAAGYTYSGYTKLISPSWVDGTGMERVLANPLARPGVLRDFMLDLPSPLLQAATWGALALELLFAPLALSRRLRPWIWLAMLSMHLGLMLLIDFADLSFAMVILHLFTFDPAWIPAMHPARRDRILYDGTCGLCHRAVRFVLAEDQREAFTFSPLPADLPQESVVVELEDGRRLERSDAARYVLARLGGVWRAGSLVSVIIPRVLRDRLYDLVARVRYNLFRRPTEACPILPPDLRSRFNSH
jgi:predicted DCC family thiol-disulfide oxidoreductase YuxK